MANKPIIVRVVYCAGTRFGDIFSVLYASGRMSEYRDGYLPKNAWDFINSREPVENKINNHGKRYIRWE